MKHSEYPVGSKIRRCTGADLPTILAIINQGAVAYRGVIPADCLGDPYMSLQQLQHEVSSGVQFWGVAEQRGLVGVMGFQDAGDVMLVRHAYVRPASQRQGIGAALLLHLQAFAQQPMLVGTWADAGWAIRFYERRGFRLVTHAQKEELLRRYWEVPVRQIETSVVLADATWFIRTSTATREQE